MLNESFAPNIPIGNAQNLTEAISLPFLRRVLVGVCIRLAESCAAVSVLVLAVLGELWAGTLLSIQGPVCEVACG